MKLPTLFKKSSTGALLTWKIEVDGSTIVVRHGQEGGAIQEGRDEVKEGKNLGKANATTAEEQACAEARSKHQKKIDREGYVEDATRAEAGETDQEGGIAPMLAQPWDKVQKKFKFPCDAQRKLDGVRCVAVFKDSDVTLWSRKRAPIVGVPHVVEALRSLRIGDAILDGELFTPGMGFQQITSFVRSGDPKPGHEKIQYHVYDVPRYLGFDRGSWKDRRNLLNDLSVNDVVHRVQTVSVDSFEDAMRYHDQWVQEGYEGAILRARNASYENKRSANLVKVKVFDQGEFKIVRVGEGRGKFAGLAMFTCVTPEGKEFECCAPGTLEDRRGFLERADQVIGLLLSVKHFGKTDDGLPRFPVGKGVRWGKDL